MPKLGIRIRLIALVAALGLMGAFIVVVTVNTQRQADALRARLTSVETESDAISAHFKDSVRELTNLRLQYAFSRDPAALAQFEAACGQLRAWIDSQAPQLSTPAETQALGKLRTAIDAYRASAERSWGVNSGVDALTAFTRIRLESRKLFDLGQALADAHDAIRSRVLAGANRRLGQMRVTTLALVGLIFLFGIALAGLAYRDLIAPLRVKLVESQTLAERHEKLASLGMLAAGVAHEIRNPLTAIKAALFIQQKRLTPGTQEYVDAEIVQREILRLERIVNDFLLFARPTEPALSDVPVAEALLEVGTLLGPGLEKAGIRLVLSPSPPLRIRADPAQIKQVLINLVQNAADSIGARGVIRLRARRDRVRLAQVETDVVILEVEDTGKGIPPDVQKRLFDPFFTTKETGTGLGLSIAARIVEKHGGALRYRTQVDRGTTFGIILPAPA
jgi:signal transduction histidine kinase